MEETQKHSTQISKSTSQNLINIEVVEMHSSSNSILSIEANFPESSSLTTALVDSQSTPPSTSTSISDPSTSSAPFLSAMKRTHSSEYRSRRHSEIVSDLDRIQQEKFSGVIEPGLLRDGRSKHPSKSSDVRIRRWSRGMLSPIKSDSKELEDGEADRLERKRRKSVDHERSRKGLTSSSGLIAGEELERVKRELSEEKKDLELKELRRRSSAPTIQPERPYFTKRELSPPQPFNPLEPYPHQKESPDLELVQKIKISIDVSGSSSNPHGLGLEGVPATVIFTPNANSTPAATTTPTSGLCQVAKTAFHNAQAEVGKGIQLKNPPLKSRISAGSI